MTDMTLESEPPVPVDYLLASISDSQAIIRALDAKASILLALLVVPVYAFNTVQGAIDGPEITNTMVLLAFIATSAVFMIAWFLSLVSCLSVLAAIDNPARHIAGHTPIGYFYQGGEFRVRSIANLLSSRGIQSRKNFSEYVNGLPRNDHAIAEDLVFEKLKVAYIRDVKAARLRVAFNLFAIWLLSALLLILIRGEM